MTSPGAQLAIAAVEHIDVPFRLHGRDAKLGLDCIGLVSASLAKIGRPVAAPSGYRLRNSNIARWLGYAENAGLVPITGLVEAGDILLIKPGPGQHHLMIAESKNSAIHAHAGLRRVVRQPFAPNTHFCARWRLPA